MKTISTKEPKSKIIDLTSRILSEGGMIVYPTETCYGLGVDATNQDAINRLMKYKTFREGKPLSVAVTDKKMAKRYTHINKAAANLYDNYLPGPVTVVTKGKHKLAKHVESRFGTLGIRIPDYPLILDILKDFDRPITATSANVSYKKKPYKIDTLLNDLPKKQKNLLDLIIDAGELPRVESSTVVDTTLNTLNIMRKGAQEFKTKGKSVLSAHTKSPEETQDFGALVMLKYIDKLSEDTLLMTLGGDLGSGKTQFTKGVARQLDIPKVIKSPTFNLIREYDFKFNKEDSKLVHIDTWRIANAKELKALQIEKYFKKGNVIVIEWADKFFDYLKEFTKSSDITILKVRFKYLNKEERKIGVESVI
jgi:L-threonylcarbamoyladenylate synthase